MLAVAGAGRGVNQRTLRAGSGRGGGLLALTAHSPSPITRGALRTYSEPTLQAATVTTQGAHCVYKGSSWSMPPAPLSHLILLLGWHHCVSTLKGYTARGRSHTLTHGVKRRVSVCPLFNTRWYPLIYTPGEPGPMDPRDPACGYMSMCMCVHGCCLLCRCCADTF